VRKSAGQHFHGVTATFTVPSVNCNVTPGSGTYGAESAQWVGLDGWQSNSRTVEQTGVDVVRHRPQGRGVHQGPAWSR
jgi:hypothetical protein